MLSLAEIKENFVVSLFDVAICRRLELPIIKRKNCDIIEAFFLESIFIRYSQCENWVYGFC